MRRAQLSPAERWSSPDRRPSICRATSSASNSGPTYRLTAEAIVLDFGPAWSNAAPWRRSPSKTSRSPAGLWAMTAGELRHAEDHMLLLGRKTAAQRVATFLLEMDRRLTVAGQLSLPMSRCDIADYLGLTLETVSRTLSLFQTTRARVELAGARHIRLTQPPRASPPWTPEGRPSGDLAAQARSHLRRLAFSLPWSRRGDDLRASARPAHRGPCRRGPSSGGGRRARSGSPSTARNDVAARRRGCHRAAWRRRRSP